MWGLRVDARGGISHVLSQSEWGEEASFAVTWNFLMDLLWLRKRKGQCSSPSPHTHWGRFTAAHGGWPGQAPWFCGKGVWCLLGVHRWVAFLAPASRTHQTQFLFVDCIWKECQKKNKIRVKFWFPIWLLFGCYIKRKWQHLNKSNNSFVLEQCCCSAELLIYDEIMDWLGWKGP